MYIFKDITLSKNITAINCGVFNDCTALESIELPENITIVDASAFNNCISLKSIILPSTTTFIGDGAFYNCTSIEYINIPNSVEYIGYDTFNRCVSLKEVFIPNSVKEMQPYCLGYNQLELLEGFTIYGTADSQSETYTHDNNINFVPITDSSNNSFNYQVNDDNTVTIIGYKSEELFKAIAHNDDNTVTIISGDKNDTSKYLYIPPTADGKPITKISAKAFYGYKNLESVYISHGIVSIGDEAFYNCTSLTEITVPESVTSIGNNIFGFDSDITNTPLCIKIYGEKNSIIESYTEMYQDKLGEYFKFINVQDTLPNGLSYKLNDDDTITITGCNWLNTNVIIPSTINGYTVSSIDNMCFWNCSNLKDVVIPKSIISIGEYSLGYNTLYNKCENFTIYGETSSQAEVYATQNEFTFIIQYNNNLIIGDINNDKSINIIDVIMLKRYLLNMPNVDIYLYNADINQSGNVNITDLFMLKKQLFDLIKS